MTDADARRAYVMASNARWRAIFAALAIVVPAGLFTLFDRQENRLRALVDHGQPAVATLTSATRQGGVTYSAYRYEVDGRAYDGSVSREDAPFAPGETFAIRYLPEDPSLSRPGEAYTRARFEGELNRPVTRGFTFGSLGFFALFALLCDVGLRRARAGGSGRPLPRLSPAAAGTLVAALLLAVTLGVELDPKVEAVQAAVFGSAPFGLPVTSVVMVAEVLLFVPMFPVFSHLMRLVMAGHARGGSLSKLGVVLAVVRADPAQRRSRAIVVGGFVYAVALMAAWIALATQRGV